MSIGRLLIFALFAVAIVAAVVATRGEVHAAVPTGAETTELAAPRACKTVEDVLGLIDRTFARHGVAGPWALFTDARTGNQKLIVSVYGAPGVGMTVTFEGGCSVSAVPAQ